MTDMDIEAISSLTRHLAHLPGIGLKTAQRLAYHILDMPDDYARELASSILHARDCVHHCSVCGKYTDIDPCTICTSADRSDSLLCVVSEARDVVALERMREYHGRYHVLGGVISPMDGIGPDDIRIKELLTRVSENNVAEVILATNPDVEGEATAIYISRLLKPMGIKVSRIARGIPIGGNLEYIDEVTLLRAVEGRRDM